MTDTLKGSCHCGAVRWTFAGDPGDATACNCTVCRRHGALWAYDWVGGRIATSGRTRAYARPNGDIGFHFCPDCGCTTWWQGLKPHPDGRTRIAVNLRMAEDPAAVAGLPVRQFDGLDRFQDLPGTGRCVADLWF